MKEVLTKSFWQGVKKTFYEALENPPALEKPPTEDKSTAPPPLAENKPEESSISDSLSSPPPVNEQK
jgi:hypothetical protein